MHWAVLLLIGSALAGSEWVADSWHGEAAWRSTSGEWTATVSAPRGRLVSLRHAGGEELLYAPSETLAALVTGRGLLGGHQTWLGPQSAWNWPPPRDWENRAPAMTAIDGGTLTIVPAHLDADFPATARSYAWDGPALAATLHWSGAGRWAMHVIQVPLTATVALRRVPVEHHAAGWSYGEDGDGFALRPPVAALSGVALDGETLRFAPVDAWRKYFAGPQAIVCTYPGGSSLRLERGQSVGDATGLPDDGLVSQVFIGKPGYGRQEIEQMSPILTGPALSFTVRLVPSR